jgi:lipid A 3-O-deacylase
MVPAFVRTKSVAVFLFMLFSGVFVSPLARGEGDAVKSGQTVEPTSQDPDADPTNFNIYIENDTQKLGGPGADSAYTSGVRFSYLYGQNKEPKWIGPVPWLKSIFDDHPYNFGMGLAQQIYTPEDLTRTTPAVNDRPYAAWLYLSPQLTISRAKSITTYELDLGVIGPYALGREAQNGIHRNIGVALAQGWDRQLGTEAGIELSIENKFSFFKLNSPVEHWKFFDILPYYGEAFGNIFVGANAGGLLRFGYNLPADYGPSRPSAADGDAFIKTDAVPQRSAEKHWSAYLFTGAKMDLALHNIFLDGNTFQSSPRVSRVPLVGEYEAGFFVQYRKVGLTWREVSRSPEFYENYKTHTFASLGLTYGQRF